MNFLNSAILAGLAAALVPLLIHLLNRRQLRTVEFSSVMFLRDLRKTRMRRLQWRRWLLLTIRTLMIALAVLAFARPALKGGLFAALGSRARTTAVLAVDRSASMALETPNGTAYDRAQRKIASMADLWGEGDEAIALPFDIHPPPTLPPTADIAALTKRLAETPVGNAGTDAGAAITAGLAALRQSENLNRELYLFSDFRREGFIHTTIPPPQPGDGNVTIYAVDVSEPGAYDLGVGRVNLENQLIEPLSPFRLSATVSNNTDADVDKLLVSLFIDGRRIAQNTANVGPGASATITFDAAVESPGVHDGFVEISADDNTLNNRRYFAVTVPDRIKVLLAADSPSGRLAAGLALAPDPTAQRRIDVTHATVDDLPGTNLFDFDCVVITDWRSPQRAVVDHLTRYVRAGGGVFAVPSFDADTTSWNMLLAGPYFSRRLGQPPSLPEPDRYFVWEDFDWSHPIWSVYAEVSREKIPELRWYAIFRTEGDDVGRTLVRFSGGRPALQEIHLDAGKLLVLWTPMNAPYTNFPLRSIFVPFMNRLAEYCAADVGERRGDFLVGEPISRELTSALSADAVLEVIAPDGSRLMPGIDRGATQVRITLDGRPDPGVYRVVAGSGGDAAIDAFSVNLDPLETAPAQISREELTRRLEGYNVVFVDGEEPLTAAVNQIRYGTEIRPAFLWAVAALFFLEMLVARTRKREMPLSGDAIGEPVRAAAIAAE